MTANNAGDGISEILRQSIHDAYGIDGSLSRLPGENLNYLVQVKDGSRYIAKVAGKDMPAGVIQMEYAALQYASRAGVKLLLPQLIVNKFGNIETRINIRNNDYNSLRILNYVDGINLSEYTDISGKLRFHLGQSLAMFNQAMRGFDHPAAHRQHRWDLAHAEQHSGKTSLVETASKREILDWAFRQLANCASPVLANLPWQFIHGDANPENIRVEDEQVVGLLDFGDSCYNPTVCDLAICLAYQMMDQVDPWPAAGQVIHGYESVRTLSADEWMVLLPLVCARLAVTISIASERRHIDPHNTNWFVSVNPAWRLLTQLHSSGRTVFADT